MSTQLLINGQLTTFNKPVGSWQNIPQSQIRVEWSPSDIVFLDGSIWTISNYSVWELYQTLLYDGNYFCSTINQWYAASNYSRHLGAAGYSPQGERWRARIFAESNFAVLATSPHYPGNTGWRLGVSVRNGLCTQKDGWNTEIFIVDLNGNRIAGYGQPLGGFFYKTTSSASRDGVYIDIEKNIIRVLSNTGDISERATALNPQIKTVSSCILRVTFIDGTTQDLNYPTCPTVEWAFNCPVACEIADRIITFLGG